MKILLIDPQWQNEDIGPKLSVGCLASAVENYADVDILEFLFRRKDLDDSSEKPTNFWIKEQVFLETIEKKLGDSDIRVVAITGWSGAFPRMLRIATICKAVRPDVHIVFGGSHVTLYERYSQASQSILSKYQMVDFLIVGEGEIPFRNLIVSLDSGRNYKSINGLVWRDGDAVIRNPETCLLDNLSEASPKWSFYRNQIDRPRWIFFVEGGRGCPHHCAFCDESDLWKKYRYKTASSVVNDIENGMGIFNTCAFRFSDSTLTASPQFERFCGEMFSRDLNAVWSCFARADEITEKKADSLAKAGCKCVLMGIESGSNKVLDFMKKNTSTNKIIDAVSILKKYDIKIRGSFIIGFPGESKEDISKTIDFAQHLELDAYAWHAYQMPFRLFSKQIPFTDFSNYELDAPFEVCMQILERNPLLLSDMHTLPKLVSISKYMKPVPENWPQERKEILEFLRLAIDKTSEVRNHDLDILIQLAKESSLQVLSTSPQMVYKGLRCHG